MPRLRLPLPTFKLFRLVLPFAVFMAGTIIFLSGLVRTYHIDRALTRNVHEERLLQSRNEHMEWWAGFTVMANAVFAMVVVVLDKPLPFKLSVFLSGCCLVLLLYATLLDAGEFSEISRKKSVLTFLVNDGHDCHTTSRNFSYAGVMYNIDDCECTKGEAFNIDIYVPFSCEVLNSLYYAHAILAFAIACAISFDLFLIFSFVLILKRISQITTALHLDEKPLSEDFSNISGDLYVDA